MDLPEWISPTRLRDATGQIAFNWRSLFSLKTSLILISFSDNVRTTFLNKKVESTICRLLCHQTFRVLSYKKIVGPLTKSSFSNAKGIKFTIYESQFLTLRRTMSNSKLRSSIICLKPFEPKASDVSWSFLNPGSLLCDNRLLIDGHQRSTAIDAHLARSITR